jgi:hypothetical protein
VKFPQRCTVPPTGDAGRFRIEGLVPGLKYLLNIKDGNTIPKVSPKAA